MRMRERVKETKELFYLFMIVLVSPVTFLAMLVWEAAGGIVMAANGCLAGIPQVIGCILSFVAWIVFLALSFAAGMSKYVVLAFFIYWGVALILFLVKVAITLPLWRILEKRRLEKLYDAHFASLREAVNYGMSEYWKKRKAEGRDQ